MSGIDHLAEFLGWLSTRVGLTVGADLFANVAPNETTGPACFVIETAGGPPHLLQSTSYIRKPRFRIDVRSTAPASSQGDYPDITASRSIAQDCFQACLDISGTSLGSTGSTSLGNWLFAIPMQEPYLAGRDDRNRVVFSFGVGCERQGP